MSAKRSKISTAEFLLPYSIGLKLRTLRYEKALTLNGLGREVGLSAALLSKLETDQMLPTLPTLARICRVYGVGLGYFFSEPAHHSLAVTRNAHITAQQPRGRDSAMSIYLHTPTADGRLLARIFDISTNPMTNVGVRAGRTEFLLYVILGRLQLNAAGSTEVLDPGDCVFLDSDASVIWRALGESPCRVLAVSVK